MMASLKIGVTGHIDITGRSRALVAAEIARELGKVEGELTGLT